MRRRYSAGGMENGERVYCCSGHSLRGVAQLTGVPLTTLKRWSGKNAWVEKKGEIGRALIEMRPNTVLLRKSIIESVSMRYHEGPIRQQDGAIPVSIRYHAGSIPAPSGQRKRTNGLNAGAGFFKQHDLFFNLFLVSAVSSTVSVYENDGGQRLPTLRFFMV